MRVRKEERERERAPSISFNKRYLCVRGGGGAKCASFALRTEARALTKKASELFVFGFGCVCNECVLQAGEGIIFTHTIQQRHCLTRGFFFFFIPQHCTQESYFFFFLFIFLLHLRSSPTGCLRCAFVGNSSQVKLALRDAGERRSETPDTCVA